MKVAIGADHAGFALKEHIGKCLVALGHEAFDFGTYSEERVDYPDYAKLVGEEVASGRVDLGVCVCGSGIGIGIAANKIPGVRAATAWDATSARLAREHNDANVLCLGARLIGIEVAETCLLSWLGSEFEGGRHRARVEKINNLDVS